jgi:hypothetical protein
MLKSVKSDGDFVLSPLTPSVSNWKLLYPGIPDEMDAERTQKRGTTIDTLQQEVQQDESVTERVCL